MSITSLIPNQSTLLIIPRGPAGPPGPAGPQGPAGVGANTQADWNANSGPSQILNRPTLAAVATSGAYNDLTGKPSLATVATTGAYNDLTGKPAIPAAPVDMTGDSGSGGVHGLAPAPPAGSAAAGKFLKADGSWAVPAGGGGSGSDFTGASAGANGTDGLVIQPNAGQQNCFLRGDASWADPGATLEHLVLRDPSITGFTGAKWELIQKAGQTNDTTGTVSQATFSIAPGEVILLRLEWAMALPDFSKCGAGQLSKAYKNVGGTITSLSTGTPTGDVLKDGGQSIQPAFTNLSSSTIDLVIFSDNTSNIYNWFINARVLRLKTNA